MPNKGVDSLGLLIMVKSALSCIMLLVSGCQASYAHKKNQKVQPEPLDDGNEGKEEVKEVEKEKDSDEKGVEKTEDKETNESIEKGDELEMVAVEKA